MTLKDILPSRLGFGAAPLGNMFRDIPEREAIATVEAAWSDGIRYYDNAPFYGAGLAEIRMGEALANKPRDRYVISTKVGRIILDEIEDVSARDLGENDARSSNTAAPTRSSTTTRKTPPCARSRTA